MQGPSPVLGSQHPLPRGAVTAPLARGNVFLSSTDSPDENSNRDRRPGLLPLVQRVELLSAAHPPVPGAPFMTLSHPRNTSVTPWLFMSPTQVQWIFVALLLSLRLTRPLFRLAEWWGIWAGRDLVFSFCSQVWDAPSGLMTLFIPGMRSNSRQLAGKGKAGRSCPCGRALWENQPSKVIPCPDPCSLSPQQSQATVSFDSSLLHWLTRRRRGLQPSRRRWRVGPGFGPLSRFFPVQLLPGCFFFHLFIFGWRIITISC